MQSRRNRVPKCLLSHQEKIVQGQLQWSHPKSNIVIQFTCFDLFGHSALRNSFLTVLVLPDFVYYWISAGFSIAAFMVSLTSISSIITSRDSVFYLTIFSAGTEQEGQGEQSSRFSSFVYLYGGVNLHCVRIRFAPLKCKVGRR